MARRGGKRDGPPRFDEIYARRQSRAVLRAERDVIGANVGANGYTTVAEAGELARRVALRPGMRLLDIGAGRGWPGIYLAERSGCEAVLIDLPAAAIHDGAARARSRGLRERCSFALASGTALPFRPAAFDAIVHTDVL